MNAAPLISAFDSFAHAAAPIAAAGAWQGLAIALSLALSLKLTRRISAAQRFALGFGAFAAIVALPLVALIAPASGSAIAASTGAASTDHAWLQLDARWIFAVAALWLIASLARATDLIVHVARLRRLWRTASPVEISTPVRSARAFEVCATQSLDRPSVIGFFAPRVLIPDWLLPRLTPGELNQIVLHESTHLSRYDDWTNLFQKLCLVLFPLNPALWIIDRQLAKERERSCDEAVVRITQAPRAYAACLASLAERGLSNRKEALSLGAWRRRSELVDRVHRILRRNRLMHPAAASVLLGSLGCSLLVGAVELARCPQLVAFVPARHAVNTVAFNHPSARLVDAVYTVDPRRIPQTPCPRLIQARAIMPSASPVKPFAGRAHAQSKAAAVGELRASSSEPGLKPVPRVLPTRQPVASPLNQDAPQLIVFTAWEQIEAPANQTVAADYDAHPDADKNPSQAPASAAIENNAQVQASGQTVPRSGAAPSAENPVPTQRRTFTQLILRVAPIGVKSSQPAAIPIGDGWFVIQL
jgi:beta-lactamase regulating signal transducer with metallopeptidase domain